MDTSHYGLRNHKTANFLDIEKQLMVAILGSIIFCQHRSQAESFRGTTTERFCLSSDLNFHIRKRIHILAVCVDMTLWYRRLSLSSVVPRQTHAVKWR